MRVTPLLSRLLFPVLLILVAYPGPVAAQPSTIVEAETFAGDSWASRQQDIRRDIQTMERDLRLGLLRIVDESPSLISKDEVQFFRRHLASLEESLLGLQAPEASVLLRKARGLRPLIDNLERAIEHPEAAVEGLAGFRRALQVEWPSANVVEDVVNDDCVNATPIGDGTFFGDTSKATPDGEGCFSGSPDAWFLYSPSVTTEIVADTFGSGFDTVLSVYRDGCPGTLENEIECEDDTYGSQSAVRFFAFRGLTYLIRVAGCCGEFGDTGPFVLNVGPGGTLAGTVTDAVTDEPVESVELEAWIPEGFTVGRAFTGPDGTYQISRLATDTYFVFTRDAQGYLREVYDDMTCDAMEPCQPIDGTPIEVNLGDTIEGIDFALHRGGSVSGTVTERTTGNPPEYLSVRVELWDLEGNFAASIWADGAGEFRLEGLAAGTYYAVANGRDYRNELYDDVPCLTGNPFEGCDLEAATPIEVSYGEDVVGIDFSLERLGVISGTILDSESQLPIVPAAVIVWSEFGVFEASATTSQAGDYRVAGLGPGRYFLTTDSFEYFDELYQDLPCEPECDPTTGTRVEIDLNSDLNIDFELERLGAIAGTLRDRENGEPIDDGGISIFDAQGNEVAFGRTSSTGTYLVDLLLPGTYTVRARHPDYRGELYDGLPCDGGNCDPTTGTPVTVAFNATTEGIDFDLERLAVLSGRVTDASTGLPIEFSFVEVLSADGTLLGVSSTESTGEYVVRGLPPGTVFAVATRFNYQDELYDDLPCEGGCDLSMGTPIEVEINQEATDIDFALTRLGAIGGLVTHLGQLVTDALVTIYDSSGNYQTDAFTDLDGRYKAEGLVPGNYFAMLTHPIHDDELFNNIPCQGGCDPTTGTPIPVVLNVTTLGINFLLDPPGSISGRVTQDGQPVSDAQVEIYLPSGDLLAEVATEPTGDYFVGGLDRGNYYAVARHPELDDELYDNLPCEPDCDPTTGTRISVNADETTPDINFALGYCTPTDTSLCLTGDRFRVEATWEDSRDGSGLARAEGLTNDSGYFWFFSPANIELVVKVLDACTDFNHFWVFGAGLTDVGVELTITDELTGEIRPYVNPLGNKYEPITDTSAFATCDAGRASQSSEVASLSVDELSRLAKRSDARSGVPEKGTECVPSETGLCLNEGRFLVEAQWRTSDDRTGSAQAIQLTGDAGYFWFFSPDNVEVVVKLLNACEFGDFNNFWVFAAGLTDVEVMLTVTDTVSGEIQEYFNPLGTAFEAVTDTAAFDTCEE